MFLRQRQSAGGQGALLYFSTLGLAARRVRSLRRLADMPTAGCHPATGCRLLVVFLKHG